MHMEKIALVHDWLVGVAGGEKVLEAMTDLYEGPIYTLLHKTGLFPERKVIPSFLQHLPKVERYYRNLLPLFPLAIERFDLSEYSLILSSSHAVAKGVRTRPDQVHICYCHTPMRYAWDLHDFHLSHLGPMKKALARPILKSLREWDQKTHPRVDHFIANSNCVAERIKAHYGREATVIYPPVDTHLFAIAPRREDYYFTCSRLVPYKRIDLLVDAFTQMPTKKLVVIGSGPELANLKEKAGPNIELLGYQPDEVYREILAKARAFVFGAVEDFGIVSVEAQSAGVPVIALGQGGSLETVLPGKTGLFFEEQSAQSLINAIEQFEKMEFDPVFIKAHAEKFAKARFQKEFQDFVTQKSSS